MCCGVSPLVPVGVDMVYLAISVTRGRGVAKHSGRLDLTWTDKDEALPPTGDGCYGYTFVDPSDYWVSEVGLFHEVSRHGAEVPEDLEPTKWVHWPVEVTMNKEITSEVVIAKHKVAVTWSNTVTNSGNAEGPWRHLLRSEGDVKEAFGGVGTDDGSAQRIGHVH